MEDSNVLCGRCSPGLSRIGQECEVCDKSLSRRNWVLLILFSVAWTAFLIVIAAYPGSTAKKKILFYFVQTLNIVLGPTSSWLVYTMLTLRSYYFVLL